jgi:hypothetical protein
LDEKHLRQIWSFLGALLCFYSVSAFIVSQGGPAILGAVFFENAPRIESVFAMPICGGLLILLSLVGTLYAKLMKTQSWAGRVPVVWLDGLDFSKPEAKIYQAFFLLLFLLVPMIAQTHFLKRVAGATVYAQDGSGHALAPFCVFDCGNISFASRYTIGDGLTAQNLATKDAVSVDWIPILQPIAFFLVFFASIIFMIRFFWHVFRYIRIS